MAWSASPAFGGPGVTLVADSPDAVVDAVAERYPEPRRIEWNANASAPDWVYITHPVGDGWLSVAWEIKEVADGVQDA